MYYRTLSGRLTNEGGLFQMVRQDILLQVTYGEQQKGWETKYLYLRRTLTFILKIVLQKGHKPNFKLLVYP